MHFEPITHAGHPLFEAAFSLYTVSFPVHEQRDRDKQSGVLANSRYHLDAIVADDNFAGLIAYWCFAGYAYVEHYAIHPARRGRSLGSAALTQFGGGHAMVVLEIDPPVDDVSRRRESFYTRLGYVANPHLHAHPAYRPGAAPHPLLVMSRPRALTDTECRRFATDLGGVVMADIGGE